MVDDVVPISLGGTGATTAQDARENLGTNDASNLTTGTLPNDRVSNSLPPNKAFRRGNILGTVSQSSGVPTGAIIERGSNANGQYVRYADGTQICTKKIVTNVAIDIAWGAIYTSSVISGGNFAASFIEAPTISFNSHDSNNNSFPLVQEGLTGSTAPDFFLARGATGPQINRTVSIIAVGRWF